MLFGAFLAVASGARMMILCGEVRDCYPANRHAITFCDESGKRPSEGNSSFTISENMTLFGMFGGLIIFVLSMPPEWGAEE